MAGQPIRTSGSSSSGRSWARVRLAISVSRPSTTSSTPTSRIPAAVVTGTVSSSSVIARLIDRMMPSLARRLSASSASAIRPPRSAATEGRNRVRISNPRGSTSARSTPSRSATNDVEVPKSTPIARLPMPAMSRLLPLHEGPADEDRLTRRMPEIPGTYDNHGFALVRDVPHRVVTGLVVRGVLARPADRLQAAVPGQRPGVFEQDLGGGPLGRQFLDLGGQFGHRRHGVDAGLAFPGRPAPLGPVVLVVHGVS